MDRHICPMSHPMTNRKRKKQSKETTTIYKRKTYSNRKEGNIFEIISDMSNKPK